MNKIKIYALGGLGEDGKNMYCVEIDDDILVFDAGLKYPNEDMMGIDFVVPSFEYLKEKKQNIKALFLSHGHIDNVGAVADFIKAFPEVEIYMSSMTKIVVDGLLASAKVSTSKINVIESFSTTKFDKYSVFAVPLTHSIPNNFGYAINTSQGIVFYAGDYFFDHSVEDIYATDIGKLAYLGKQGVLCFLGESSSVANRGHTSPNHRVAPILAEFFENANKRAFVTSYSSNIMRLQEILDESLIAKRKVAIYGKLLKNIIERGIESGMIKFPKEELITIFDVKNMQENHTIIVSGERDRPYSGLMRILEGQDKNIKITSEDSVLMLSLPVPGTIKIYASVNDLLYQTGADVKVVNRKEIKGCHASQEDVLLMLNLLQPKYYLPVKGEYRNQVAGAEAARIAKLSEDNILLLDNGEVIEFENKQIVDKYFVASGDVLVDGHDVGNIASVIMKDRESLKENGIVIVSAIISKKHFKIIGGPEVHSRGFVFSKENKAFIADMEKLCEDVINESISNRKINFGEIKLLLRESLAAFIYDEKGRRPMIITMIQTI